MSCFYSAKINITWSAYTYGMATLNTTDGILKNELPANVVKVQNNGTIVDIPSFSLPYGYIKLIVNASLLPEKISYLFSVEEFLLHVVQSPLEVTIMNGSHAKARYTTEVCHEI